jgi:hypothetical protein
MVPTLPEPQRPFGSKTGIAIEEVNMAEQTHRVERDSMGEVKVPKEAYYGAQTQRAFENFPISGIGFPAQFIHALGGKNCSRSSHVK